MSTEFWEIRSHGEERRRVNKEETVVQMKRTDNVLMRDKFVVKNGILEKVFLFCRKINGYNCILFTTWYVISDESRWKCSRKSSHFIHEPSVLTSHKSCYLRHRVNLMFLTDPDINIKEINNARCLHNRFIQKKVSILLWSITI